jgi:hypothetical protein
VWLKDLDGRYLQINRRYAEVLATAAERLLGRTDEELPAAEVVDGPRLLGARSTSAEPLQLEYTIAAFHERPALAVLRFPVRDAQGDPVAICGVAAPLGEAHIARSECARLMRLESLPDAPVAPKPSAQSPGDDSDEVAELRRALDEGQRRIAALHEASATAARRAHELMSALTQEQEHRAELERALASDRTADRTALMDLQAALEAEHAELERERGLSGELRDHLAEARRELDRQRWSPAAQRALSAALCGASEWRTGLKDAIKVLGGEGKWDVVSVWAPGERRALRCIATWTGDPDGYGAFETLTWQRPEDVDGSGLGRAWTSPEPVVITDLQGADAHRLKLAADAGMRTALYVPVRDGVNILGLIEFLSRSDDAPDRGFLTAMEAVALQLAHFAHLLRLGAKPHWRFGRV